jgi:hypothetical protein
MESVWYNYTIHLQIFYIISAHWLCILQMAYNLHCGHGVGDKEQLPPPPPPFTPAELRQMVVESQHLLDEAMHQLVNRDD